MTKKIFNLIPNLLLLILLFSTVDLGAYDFRRAMDEGKTFAQIQAEAKQFYEERGITIDTPKDKRMGFKQYNRWEWFWSTRLMPDGSFPPSGYVYQEMERYLNEHNSLKGKKTPILQAHDLTKQWNFLGPKTAPGGYSGIGRINSIKEDPNYNDTTNRTIWAGTASGGLWKSTDAGTTWSNMTPNMGTLGVGDLCINPKNSNEVWLATGDGDAGDAYSLGIMKSTNGGTTWAVTGLTFKHNNYCKMRRIIQDANKPDTMFVSTNRGVYRTYDGWATYTRVFTTSSYDLVFKPGTTSTLYLSTYNDVYKSTDGGSNWTQLTNGLPNSSRRVAIAVAPNNSNYLYAEYTNTSSGHAGFYRSTNSGTSFTKMDTGTFKNLLGWRKDGNDTGGQSWYDLTMVVNPTDADEVYVGGVNSWKSTNGGATWNCMTMWYSGSGLPAVHADHHYLYMPNSNRLYSANDGGVDISTNQGASWTYKGSGIHCTQFYRIGISQNDTSLVIAGAQDNSSFLKDGNSFAKTVSTGDGFEGIIDYTNDDVMYTSSYYGNWDISTNKGKSWSRGTIPHKNPGAWLTPYVMSPSNHNIIYFGFTDSLYKYDNSLGTNTFVSDPDSNSTLSINNLAIAPSNSSAMLMGSRSQIMKTIDAGVTWSSTSLPQSARVNHISYHPNDANKVWLANGNFYSGKKVYYSTNGGTSWTNISGTLPNVPCNCVICVSDSNSYILFAGMDTGVWYRKENDTDWTQFSSNLPSVVVTELEYNEDKEALFAATYGRGLWKIDLKSITIVPPPSVPTLTIPPMASEDIIVPPTLQWNSAANAVKYRMEYSTYDDFSADVNSVKNITTTSYSPTGLIDNTKYYWRVKSYSLVNDSSAWSNISYFTTGACEPTLAKLNVDIRLYGRYDSQLNKHDKVAVRVELHDTLNNIINSANAIHSFGGFIGADGTAKFKMGGVDDGEYNIIIKVPGYLPIIFPNKELIENGETCNLSALQTANIVGGITILHYENNTYYLKSGDVNDDQYINAYDAIFIPKNNGTDVNTSFPKP